MGDGWIDTELDSHDKENLEVVISAGIITSPMVALVLWLEGASIAVALFSIVATPLTVLLFMAWMVGGFMIAERIIEGVFG